MRKAHVVDRPIAADRTVHEATKGEFLFRGRRTRLLGRDGLIEDQFAVDPGTDARQANAGHVIVPLTVGRHAPGREFTASTRDIEAESARAAVGLELPMSQLGLVVAGDDDVVVGLAVEARADFDRDRPGMEGRLALGDVATGQRITEFGRKRGHRLGGRALLLRGRLGPRAVLGRRRREGTVELSDQPSQAREIVLQAPFGVRARVVQDADRAAVTARADLPQDGQIEMTRAQRLDLLPLGFAIGVHAVEVEAEQVRH